MRRSVGLLVLGLLSSLWTSSAAALGGEAGPRVYGGILGGYSIATDDPAADPTGAALGLRAGLTLPSTDVYVGAAFLYHFGEDADVLGAELSASSLMFGIEGGYELDLGAVTLRPSLGIGFQVASIAADANLLGLESQDSTDPYLSPGVGVFLDVGVLLGAEARYNIVFNERYVDSISLLASIGFVL